MLPSFFDPLPDDVLDAFGPVFEDKAGAVRVAEAKGRYTVPARRPKHT